MTLMEKSKYMETINGKKYLPVEVSYQAYNKDSIVDTVLLHGGIFQGIKEVRQTGWWNAGYVIYKCLIPEENVLPFNAAMCKL